MIKIAVISERLSDQCTWYRSTGPFSDSMFRKNGILFKYIIQPHPEQFGDLADCDLVFILRPYKKIDHDMMVLALSMNKPVWVDFDDDFSVPEQCEWSAQHIKTQDFFNFAVKFANKITVSTPSIKETIMKLTDKEVEIIPNGFNFELLEKRMKREVPSTKTSIAWRGSATHENDLKEVAQYYATVMKKNKEFITYFYGSYPKFLAYYIPHTHMNFPITQFHNVLADNQHKILMHPLENTQWNKGKSNAAWLEATMAGCVVVSRNLPEWRQPNCYTYETPSEFASTIDYLCMMEKEKHLDSVKMGQEHIRERFNLQTLNKRRFEIIQELIG